MLVTIEPLRFGPLVDTGEAKRSCDFGAPKARVSSTPSLKVSGTNAFSVRGSGKESTCATFCCMSEDNLNVTDDAAIRPWNVPERDVLSGDEQIFFQLTTCQCSTCQ